MPGRPFKNPKKLSITELEYRHAGAHKIPRLVVLKDENVISITSTDLKTKEHAPERIEHFRAPAGREQRPAIFKDVHELRERVVKDFNAFKEKQEKSSKPRARARRGARMPSSEDLRRGSTSSGCAAPLLHRLGREDCPPTALSGRCAAGDGVEIALHVVETAYLSRHATSKTPPSMRNAGV